MLLWKRFSVTAETEIGGRFIEMDVQITNKHNEKRFAHLSFFFIYVSIRRVFTWGWGVHGQLGHGDSCDVTIPKEMTSLSDVTRVKGGYAHTLFLSVEVLICLLNFRGLGGSPKGITGTLHNPAFNEYKDVRNNLCGVQNELGYNE